MQDNFRNAFKATIKAIIVALYQCLSWRKRCWNPYEKINICIGFDYTLMYAKYSMEVKSYSWIDFWKVETSKTKV